MSELTNALLLSARDTDITETPAFVATSCKVGRVFWGLVRLSDLMMPNQRSVPNRTLRSVGFVRLRP
jgi:hypothetical protein